MVIGLLVTTQPVCPQDYVQKKEFDSGLIRVKQSLAASKKQITFLEQRLMETRAQADTLVMLHKADNAQLSAQADTLAAMQASMAIMLNQIRQRNRFPVTLTASIGGLLAFCLLGLLFFTVRQNRRLSQRIEDLVRLRDKDTGEITSGLAVVSDRIRQCHEKLENAEATFTYRINSGLTAHDTRILLLERHNAEKYSQVLSNIDALNGAIATSRAELTATIDKLSSMERELAGRVVTIEKELHH